MEGRLSSAHDKRILHFLELQMSGYARVVEQLEGFDECKPAVFAKVKQLLSIMGTVRGKC